MVPGCSIHLYKYFKPFDLTAWGWRISLFRYLEKVQNLHIARFSVFVTRLDSVFTFDIILTLLLYYDNILSHTIYTSYFLRQQNYHLTRKWPQIELGVERVKAGYENWIDELIFVNYIPLEQMLILVLFASHVRFGQIKETNHIIMGPRSSQDSSPIYTIRNC